MPSVGKEEAAAHTLSEYELLRLANIARNESILRELGLLREDNSSNSSSKPYRTSRRPLSRTTRTRRKRIRDDDSGQVDPSLTHAPLPQRRSQRLQAAQQQPGEDKDEEPIPSGALRSSSRMRMLLRSCEERSCDNDSVRKSCQTSSVLGSSLGSGTFVPRMSNMTDATLAIPPDSTRAITLDVPRLLDRMLGRTLNTPGKAAVVMEATRIAATESIHNSSRSFCPRFNKYSGVLEWSDNAAAAAAFLWINLGGQDADGDVYRNQFRDDGRLVNWYASPRVHPGSPVLRRLLAVGIQAAGGPIDYAAAAAATPENKATKGSRCSPLTSRGGAATPAAADDDEGNSDKLAVAGTVSGLPKDDEIGKDTGGVVLWCRRNDPNLRSSFEPYTCLGRLRLVSYDLSCRPIELVWELVDRDRLLQAPSAAREKFRSLVQDFSRE